MPSIVINYQEEGGVDALVEALHIDLLKAFGEGQVRVGMGRTFAEAQIALIQCEVLLVVIGQQAAGSLTTQILEEALSNGKRVVGVVTQGDPLPTSYSSIENVLSLKFPYSRGELGDVLAFLKGINIASVEDETGKGDATRKVPIMRLNQVPSPPLFTATLRREAPLLMTATPHSQTIKTLPQGLRVEVIRRQSQYMQVNVNDQIGWVEGTELELEAEGTTVKVQKPQVIDSLKINSDTGTFRKATPPAHTAPKTSPWQPMLWIIALVGVGVAVLVIAAVILFS